LQIASDDCRLSASATPADHTSLPITNPIAAQTIA
jgi:hypothetical protein